MLITENILLKTLLDCIPTKYSVTEVELRHTFSASVYFIWLHFKSDYFGLSQQNVITLKTQLHAVNAR